MLEPQKLKPLLEAVLLAAGRPMNESELLGLFVDSERPSVSELRQALYQLQEDTAERGYELREVASGYQMQSKAEFASWIARLWEEKPPKYSRALLETLALIAYRQPITRGEIEDIRGVSISTSIFKTLLEERGWIRVVGHKELPGKPGLYATTKQFLDYFGLKSLDQLPSLPEVLGMKLEENLQLDLSLEQRQQVEIEEEGADLDVANLEDATESEDELKLTDEDETESEEQQESESATELTVETKYEEAMEKPSEKSRNHKQKNSESVAFSALLQDNEWMEEN